jgi:hypothetical protein
VKSRGLSAFTVKMRSLGVSFFRHPQQPDAVDRFELPLRIPEALPNNNDVEPKHGTGGNRDHVVHNFSLRKKDKIAPRIGLPRFGFAWAEIALAFHIMRARSAHILATAAKQISFARIKMQP